MLTEAHDLEERDVYRVGTAGGRDRLWPCQRLEGFRRSTTTRSSPEWRSFARGGTCFEVIRRAGRDGATCVRVVSGAWWTYRARSQTEGPGIKRRCLTSGASRIISAIARGPRTGSSDRDGGAQGGMDEKQTHMGAHGSAGGCVQWCRHRGLKTHCKAALWCAARATAFRRSVHLSTGKHKCTTATCTRPRPLQANSRQWARTRAPC